VVFVGTDVSEEHIASIFKVKTANELKHVDCFHDEDGDAIFLQNVGS
jgi:hypothetical protein